MNLPNNKTFLITIKKFKTYQLLIDGFSKTSLWFITIINNLDIYLEPKLIKTVFVAISDVLGISLATPKMIKKSSVTNSLVNRITLTSKGIYKITSSISSAFSNTLLAKLRKKASTTYQSVVDFTFSILVATFTALSVHDPSALSAMDTETLADLDYTTA